MSEVYDRLVQHAYFLVEVVAKEYKEDKKIAFFPVLAGIGNCAVEYRGQGHNSYAVVDAINEYYWNTKDETIKNGYEDGILTMIRLAKNIQSLQDTLDILYYQCKLEKEGKAKVHVNVAKIVEFFNKNMKDNYDELNNILDFLDWYNGQKKLAKSKYGLELY